MKANMVNTKVEGRKRIKVNVEVMSWLKEDFDHEGWDRLVFDQETTSGSSLMDLVQDLAGKYPKFKQKAFAPKQSFLDYCAVVHNDRFISALHDLNIKLKEGDNIKLTPGFYGG